MHLKLEPGLQRGILLVSSPAQVRPDADLSALRDAATALHGHAGPSQSSLSADMPLTQSLSSASPRHPVIAAHVGAETDVRPG